MATDDNDLILSRLRGAPVQYMTRLEMMMSGMSVQRIEGNDNGKEPYYYGPDALKYGLPYGLEGLRSLANQPMDGSKLNNLPYANGIPFPPDPNKP